MQKDRLTAFSDGVIAVIITIMVLEVRPPHDVAPAALWALAPSLGIYALSFIYVGIYWTNHHHFYHLVETVDGAVLWANLNLLFWLSLIPFATAWMGEHPAAPVPTALYGVSLLASALAWWVMQRAIIRSQGGRSALATAIGPDVKGQISPLLYLLGIGLAFIQPWLADLAYAGVAALWLVPDRRVEARLRP